MQITYFSLQFALVASNFGGIQWGLAGRGSGAISRQVPGCKSNGHLRLGSGKLRYELLIVIIQYQYHQINY